MTKIKKTDEQWKAELSDEAYRITREHGTESPYSGEYDQCFEPGTYNCVACGAPLFISDDKYDPGCGWPSFSKAADNANISEHTDDSLGRRRVEVRCENCDAHLGHVFPDGPVETGLRYCINSVALKLEKK